MMSKIYNIIPGKRIEDSLMMRRILELIDSIGYDDWIELDEDIYSLDFFQNNQELYVMYLDPRGIIERLYITPCKDILYFMKERINKEYGEGVDIVICTKEIENVVICNHDGEIFLIK